MTEPKPVSVAKRNERKRGGERQRDEECEEADKWQKGEKDPEEKKTGEGEERGESKENNRFGLSEKGRQSGGAPRREGARVRAGVWRQAKHTARKSNGKTTGEGPRSRKKSWERCKTCQYGDCWVVARSGKGEMKEVGEIRALHRRSLVVAQLG